MSADVAIDLPSFLHITERLLGLVIDHREQLIPEDLREQAEKAWKEFRRIDATLISQARDIPTVTLNTVGLSGEQLKFKLATYNHILGKFREKKDIKWLRMLLKVTDDILGSLVEILTITEPLKVMQENLLSAIDLFEAEKSDGDSQEPISLPDEFEL